VIPAELDVDGLLDVVVRDERTPMRARGELVGAADELVTAFALTLAASPQTQRTYVRACRAFVAWLGPLAGPEDLTAANVAAYHAELVRSGLASSTVKKERSTRSCAGSSSLST
jgi:Phage integrase, N-terminal SAM-like domain